MDITLMKSIIDRFDRNTFEEFFQKLLINSYGNRLKRLRNIDDRIFERPPERFYQNADSFFMCYSPYSIYNSFSPNQVDFLGLKNMMSQYISSGRESDWLWRPIYGINLYVINNFDSEKMGISDEELANYYEKELSSILPDSLYQIGVGNINTFAKASDENSGKLQDVLSDFIANTNNRICITLSDNGAYASRFFVENEFAGVTKNTRSLIQPTLRRVSASNDILVEFNKLIFSDTKESTLEEFLRQYYKEIFGGKYDRISTQLWLKFPDLDIGQKDRRLDIFMRNAVLDDWELFELKRSNVPLTRTVSDVPMFVSAVNNAIAQTKNYKRLLEQDKVKKALAAEGIGYYEPEVNLVIGKKPSIPISHWRRLLADNQSGIRITTYDTLLDEAKRRLTAMEEILK